MLHAGLDLSRKRLDVCLLSEHGELVEEFSAPPDADGLRGLAQRVALHGEPVCAVIESMTGARIVHDTLEQQGWEVEIADAQKVKGLAPLACKTDKIDARVLAVLSHRDLVPAIWLPDPRGQAGARAGPLSPAPGQAPLGAQEPYPLDPDQLRAALPGHRPVRGRGPPAAEATTGPGALAGQHHRLDRADRRPRTPDRRDQPPPEGGPRRAPLHPLLMSAPGIGWVLAFTIAAEIGETRGRPGITEPRRAYEQQGCSFGVSSAS